MRRKAFAMLALACLLAALLLGGNGICHPRRRATARESTPGGLRARRFLSGGNRAGRTYI